MTLKAVFLLLRYAPLIFGILGVAFSAYGALMYADARLTYTSATGLVVGVILIASNLLPLTPRRTRSALFLTLLLLYVLGTLATGFRAKTHTHEDPVSASAFLALEPIRAYDAIINVVGFVPLGFLFVATAIERSWFASPGKSVGWAVFAAAVATLLIESGQSLLADRSSSLTDVFTNLCGALIGALYAVVFCRYWALR